MFTCPDDHTPLARIRTSQGLAWVCPTCGGRAVGVGVLRKTIIAAPINRLWLAAHDRAGRLGRPCPVCGRRMEEVPGQDGGPPLDVCIRCYVVWFDPKEYELMPPSPAAAQAELPPEAREIMALEQVRELHEEAEQQLSVPPDEWWKVVPGLFGMPVEFGDQALRIRPWATWTVAAAVLAASLLAFRDLAPTVAALGLIPAQVARDWGATLLTSFFIHGSVFHLVSNLYFLVVFGDNVEEYLAVNRYLLLLLLATVTGGLAHVAADARSTVPVIGASGGISGLIAFYVLRFPQARLGVLMGPLFTFRWIRIRAYAFGLLWVILQVVGAWQQIEGASAVSALAHLGGAAAGAAFWLVTRKT